MPRRPKPPKPYKSMLEYNLHVGSMVDMEYEPFSIDYSIEANYTPDFVPPNNKSIWYEVKGRFRTYDEAKKYLAIQKQYPNINLRFVLSNPNTKAYPQAKKLTLSQWCDKHEFEWCAADDIPEEWL